MRESFFSPSPQNFIDRSLVRRSYIRWISLENRFQRGIKYNAYKRNNSFEQTFVGNNSFDFRIIERYERLNKTYRGTIDEKSIDLRPISPRELRRGNRSKILSRRSLIMEPFSDAKDEISCKVTRWIGLVWQSPMERRDKKIVDCFCKCQRSILLSFRGIFEKSFQGSLVNLVDTKFSEIAHRFTRFYT